MFSQSARWPDLSSCFANTAPFLHAYPITTCEFELMHRILDFHLSDKVRFTVCRTKDQLVAFDDLLDLFYRAQELSKKKKSTYPYQQRTTNGQGASIGTIPSIQATFVVPSARKVVLAPLMPSNNSILNAPTSSKDPPPVPVPDQRTSSIPSELNPIFLYKAMIEGHGWIQINNVCLPFLVKYGQRLVPYQPLVSCQILNSQELTPLLTRTTATDIVLINRMIRECRIHHDGLVENAPLINLQHLLMGSSSLLYVKILPKDTPKPAINRQFKDVLAMHGGCLTLNNHSLPFVSSYNRSYVPLPSIVSIYPNLQPVLQSLARVPHANDLEYLQLVQFYYGHKELPLDTLLINMEDLEQMQIIASKTISLEEYRAGEKIRFEQQVQSVKKMLMSSGKRKHQAHRSKSKQPQKLEPLPSNDPSCPTDQSRQKRSRWQ